MWYGVTAIKGVKFYICMLLFLFAWILVYLYSSWPVECQWAD